MRRSLLAGGGVVAVILAIALLVRGCAPAETDAPPVARDAGHEPIAGPRPGRA